MLRRKRAKDDGMCVRRLRRNLLSTFHLPLRAYAATQYYSVLHVNFLYNMSFYQQAPGDEAGARKRKGRSRLYHIVEMTLLRQLRSNGNKAFDRTEFRKI